MKRWFAATVVDFVHQYRNGFVWVGLFAVLLWTALLRGLTALPEPWYSRVMVVFFGINGIMTTFFFVAALVLLEREQGILAGLVTSPLKAGEYLGAKCFSLGVLALVETLLIAVLGVPLVPHWLLLVLGLVFLGLQYTLLGVLVVSRHRTLSEFLMPSVGAILFLLLPFCAVVGLCSHHWFWWHPVHYPLQLIRFSFSTTEVSGVSLLVAGSGCLLFLVPVWWWAERACVRMAREAL